VLGLSHTRPTSPDGDSKSSIDPLLARK